VSAREILTRLYSLLGRVDKGGAAYTINREIGTYMVSSGTLSNVCAVKVNDLARFDAGDNICQPGKLQNMPRGQLAAGIYESLQVMKAPEALYHISK
jgi:hypothetical protein